MRIISAIFSTDDGIKIFKVLVDDNLQVGDLHIISSVFSKKERRWWFFNNHYVGQNLEVPLRARIILIIK